MKNLIPISIFSSLAILLLCLPSASTPLTTEATAAPPVQPPVSIQWKFERNAQGLLTAITDPAGKTTKVQYELHPNKRFKSITRVRADGSRVVHEMDRLGRRVRLIDSVGTVSYRYGRLGLIRQIQRTNQPAIQYEHDTNGRIRSVQIGDRFKVGYEYDFLGRLSAMITPEGRISYRYHYQSGRVTRELPNGIRTVWQYRPDGKLDNISHSDADLNVLSRFTYAYRPDGLVHQIRKWQPTGEKTLKYEYDQAHRLVSVTDSQRGKISWRYDDFGNRLAVTQNNTTISSEQDWSGQIVKHQGADCSQDRNGNLLELTDAVGKRTLSYNSENRVASVQAGEQKVEYRYDGEGNLIQRKVGEEVTSFLPNPLSESWQPLLATDAKKNQTFYVWDGSVPVMAIRNGKAEYYLQDHLSSVHGITNAKGEVVQRFEHTPFGVTHGKGLKEWQPGFAGLFYDPLARFYVTRYRSYDPALGRFYQPDPIHRIPTGSQNDLSAYVYCGNDPVNFVDIDGAEPDRPVQYAVDWWAARRDQTIANATPENWIVQGFKATGADLARIVIEHNPIVDAVGLENAMINVMEGKTWQERALGTGKIAADLGLSRIKVAEKVIKGGTRFLVNRNLQKYVTNEALPGIHRAYTGGLKLLKEIDEIETGIDRVKSAYSLLSDIGGEWKKAGIFKSNDADQGARDDFRFGNDQRFGALPPPPPPGGGLSNIGGISLKGAGAALKDFGPLQGVTIDENGRLVLIAAEQGEVKLPPLKLEDVVVIFTSVYASGVGPYVSIDPDPKDPKGPRMLVRLPEELKKTYAGYILFEADRVMKVYSVGHDNNTGRRVTSRILNYKTMFHFPSGDDKLWERFWILPKEVTRHQSTKDQLTLFDVALRLNAEPMILRNGKLETAPDAKPSEGALYFTKWFTQNYDNITKEARIPAPKGTDLPERIHVFEELRRLTLITAIAESLRDQGVPMPAWMRSYPLKPFPVPDETPGRHFKVRTRDGGIRKIYGGATTSPETVRTVQATEAQIRLANAVKAKVKSAPPLTPITLETGGNRYKLVALPGNETKVLGAHRMQEVDLAIPLNNGTSLRLERRFHSFFQPEGELGRSWTLDLPQLKRAPRRSDKPGQYHVSFQVSRPLQPASTLHDGYVPGTIMDQRTFSFTQSDGSRAHFTKEGQLVAVEQAGLTILYHRDEQGRITKLEGKTTTQRVTIDLKHNTQGLLESATTSTGKTVRYGYDDQGHLSEVKRPDEKLGYSYDNGLVTNVKRNGTTVRKFEYAEDESFPGLKGRLRAIEENGKKVVYKTETTPEGMKVTSTEEGSESSEEFLYDHNQHLLSGSWSDGTKLTRKRLEDGTRQTTLISPEGDRYVRSRSKDGTEETWKLPDGADLNVKRDKKGRVTHLKEGDRIILEQSYDERGRVKEMRHESVVVTPQRSPDGQISSLSLNAPGEQGRTQWVQMDLDKSKRPIKITDYSGMKLEVSYNRHGIAKIKSGQGTTEVIRDAKGQIREIKQDENQRMLFERGPKGETRKVTVKRGSSAEIEYENGKPVRLRQFDGGKMAFAWQKDKAGQARLKSVRDPNNLELSYVWAKGRVQSVKCGARYRMVYRYNEKNQMIGMEQVPLKK